MPPKIFGGIFFCRASTLLLSSTLVSGFSLQVLAALRAFRYNPGYGQHFFSYQPTCFLLMTIEAIPVLYNGYAII
jgi:hypothetical protein